MINDFIKIGISQGDCIVFPERNNTFNGVSSAPKSVVGPDQIDITNQYMMALALEYKILSRNNQSTDETIKELYHLLYTFNRLDLMATSYETKKIPIITPLTKQVDEKPTVALALVDGSTKKASAMITNSNLVAEIAPNPTNGLCKVFLTNPSLVTSIEVVDAFAKSLFTIDTISYSNDIDLSSFAKGVYTIIIRGNQGEVTIKKVVVQ